MYFAVSKTFDRVLRSRLWYKLKECGIGGPLLKRVNEFLSDRYMSVKVGRDFSNWKEVSRGVSQGSILGPILFLFILPIWGSRLFPLVFYTPMILSYTTQVLVTKQTEDIQTVVTWRENWLLLLNKDKCVPLHIGKNNSKQHYLVENATKISRLTFWFGDFYNKWPAPVSPYNEYR